MTTHPGGAQPRGWRLALAGGFAAGLLLLISTAVLAASVPTDPEPDLECPDAYGTGLLTKYVTTVNTPADSTDWWVSVQFTVIDEPGVAASCELSLATYELPGPDFVFPQTLFSSATGTFGAGTHTLTAPLPREGEAAGCFSQYDFVFGPPIQDLTFDNRYDSRQIRARITGTESCAIVTPTPSPTPEGGEQGSTSQPSLPSTSMRGGESGSAPSSAALIFGLVLMLSLGALGYANLRAVAARGH